MISEIKMTLVVAPKYDFPTMLGSILRNRISHLLWVVSSGNLDSGDSYENHQSCATSCHHVLQGTLRICVKLPELPAHVVTLASSRHGAQL